MDNRVNIERLKAEIALKRSALLEHRAALQKLQSEIDAFARQYDRVIGPLESQLDSIRQMIEDMESRPPANPGGIWGPGYASFEESFDAKYRHNPQGEMIKPQKRRVDELTLRTLYRKLARKYHPDTTTNPAEKVRLTVIMAQINAAYRAKNADELYALDGQRPAKAVYTPPKPATTPLEPTYIELVTQSQKLDDEILMVKSEQQRLLTGPLMSLKIEYSIARSQGRDLLRELADKVRIDLKSAQSELDTLRRRMR